MMSAVYVHIKYRCHLIRPPAMLLASTLGFCNPLGCASDRAQSMLAAVNAGTRTRA
jgi:hypothetical protein